MKERNKNRNASALVLPSVTQARLAFADAPPFAKRRPAKLPATPKCDALKRVKQAELAAKEARQ